MSEVAMLRSCYFIYTIIASRVDSPRLALRGNVHFYEDFTLMSLSCNLSER